jgi:hypothetical protein
VGWLKIATKAPVRTKNGDNGVTTVTFSVSKYSVTIHALSAALCLASFPVSDVREEFHDISSLFQ